MLLDDGGDLTKIMHEEYPDLILSVRGVSEETTTGVLRLHEMEKDGLPMVLAFNVNDSGENKSVRTTSYEGRESLTDGIRRATGRDAPGQNRRGERFQRCRQGVGASLRNGGARVIVTEVDPIQALQAAMEGYEVSTMDDYAPKADIFVTATGNKDIITVDHMRQMKDRAIVCNIGHFDTEIQVDALRNYRWHNVKPQVDEIEFPDGKRILLLAEGRLVNLGCATGHPSFVMSASFTNQVLAQIELWNGADKYQKKVYVLPKKLDEKVAELHLARVGAKLTKMSAEQASYIGVSPQGPYKADTYRY